MLGRSISADEDVKGGPRNVVVSNPFWRDFLGSDPRVLGKSMRLSGNTYTIIGVMPMGFALPKEPADIFVSLWVAYPDAASERDVHFMHTYWRLKPGVTPAQAQAEVAQVDRRLAEQFPDSEKGRAHCWSRCTSGWWEIFDRHYWFCLVPLAWYC
jgi:putative ABC transport system permease protein